MQRVIDLVAMFGALVLSGCVGDEDVCLTKGAVKNNGICDCPVGMRTFAGACVGDNASVAGINGDGGTDRSVGAMASEGTDSGVVIGLSTFVDAGPLSIVDSSIVVDSAASRDARAEDAAVDARIEVVSDAGAMTSTPAPCTQKVWYLDCDGDGYSAGSGTTACTQPSLPANCLAWMERAPANGQADCDDRRASYHPGATFGVAGDGNGDLNCDGKVETNTVFVAGASGQTRTSFPICPDPEWRPRDVNEQCTCYRPGWIQVDFGGFVPGGTARTLNTAGQESTSSAMNLVKIPADPNAPLVFPTKIDCSRQPNEVIGLGYFFRSNLSGSDCTTEASETYAVRQLCR